MNNKNHPLYKTWKNMKERCSNKNHPKYNLYGARGITVCDSWARSFKAFLHDMGDKPSKSHSIDRINNDGNYEPTNCRWADAKTQANNKRIGTSNADRKEGAINHVNKNNKSGFNGVSWVAKKKKWYATITINGRKKYLGLYENIQDAVEARRLAEIQKAS